MRKLTGALCLLGALAAVPAYASDVAVLDWREALMQSDAAQRSMNELRNQTSAQRQQADDLGKQLQQLQQKLQKDGAVMSDNERQKVRQELSEKGQRFQQLRAQIQQTQQEKQQAFLQSAKPRLDKAIQKVVDEHHVKVVLDRDAVVYRDDSLDLTQEVTRILNAN
ncbi:MULTISPECIES: OmpH family outer membrane protein [unclassified Modicisalibacter]|uniref:OmpH family outer membrane protein n=1 Tax=unclassified Modicisalibacter TaxID=2679913 RepID=UPI001CCC0727|nr:MULTISPECIES: OmpH family outer membrane protein [unclassified Modicisalibacter]MBZ9558125.1 OmpH family outer membrane protein [Modicisalibacter sp. R2A 31.J]MBZ9573206.1 OmpH family outer membrane protein [Modicisalibacter sp. MOD 31.J]